MKTDRLLALTIYLINTKGATARQMAERFEVSVRTIQRDMDSLALAGIPVYTERGRDGGYRIIENYTVNRQFFSNRELASLTSLVGRLNNLLDHSRLKATEEKLKVLGEQQTTEHRHEPLIMDLTPWGMDEQTRSYFRTVYRAVEEHRVLQLGYASLSGQRSNRQVEPLSIVIKGAAWYIYGFCRLRRATRLFKLTRIYEVKELPLHFLANDHPPYQDEQGWAEDTRPRTLFVLRFDPAARGQVSDYAHSNHVQEMPDGTLLGFFPFPEDNWVYSWILSFGTLVEVLEPPHARDHLRELVQGMSAKYPLHLA